jgi:hypothetical protein
MAVPLLQGRTVEQEKERLTSSSAPPWIFEMIVSTPSRTELQRTARPPGRDGHAAAPEEEFELKETRGADAASELKNAA